MPSPDIVTPKSEIGAATQPATAQEPQPDMAAIKKDMQRDEDAHKRLDEQDERIARIERNLGLKE